MKQVTNPKSAEDLARTINDSMIVGASEVADVMTSKVVTLSPHNTFSEAANLMNDRYFRHCVIVDAHGQIVGVISDRDILRAWRATPTPGPNRWIRS